MFRPDYVTTTHGFSNQVVSTSIALSSMSEGLANPTCKAIAAVQADNAGITLLSTTWRTIPSGGSFAVGMAIPYENDRRQVYAGSCALSARCDAGLSLLPFIGGYEGGSIGVAEKTITKKTLLPSQQTYSSAPFCSWSGQICPNSVEEWVTADKVFLGVLLVNTTAADLVVKQFYSSFMLKRFSEVDYGIDLVTQ